MTAPASPWSPPLPDRVGHEADGVAAAAILDTGETDVDQLLLQVSHTLKAAGTTLRGLLMTWPGGKHSCASEMVLVDLHRADTYLVSQPLGAGSDACRADPQGFARASQVLREALQAQPDLVISNRFGGLEAEGGGFAAELLELMAAGVPVLTAVAPRHLAAWQAFTGGTTILEAEATGVLAWVRHALAARAATAPAAAPR